MTRLPWSVRRDEHSTDEITFWSITGQKLATYAFTQSGSTASVTIGITNYYFGRKLIKNGPVNGSAYVTPDRLGSIGKFYPWGQEKPSATQNGTEKFTGYFRDAETGLDYAMNRFHNPGTGRFMTPDPYMNSAGPTDPGSWNRYAYTRGDPVNRLDPNGTCDFMVSGMGDASCGLGGDPLSNPCVWGFFEPGDNPDSECVGGPSYYAGPLPGGGGGTPPPVNCENQLTAEIGAYLTGKESPLADYAQTFVADAKAAGINPLLLVAISGAESSYGTSGASQRTQNAFGILHGVKQPDGKTKYVLRPFSDWGSGIAAAARIIDSQFVKGNVTVSEIYGGQPGAYCVNSPGHDCTVGESNVESIFKSFLLYGGNPNNPYDLIWPCGD
jgi:RHS repeat-associated protein